MLSDHDILERLRGSGQLEEACGRLVRDANTRGGYDNVSVVLVRVDEGDEEEEDDDDVTTALPALR